MIKAKPRNFLFNEVHMEAPERNGFDLSHENKQTARAGVLYPFEIFETLPADDIEINVEQFIRLNPMLSPTMHRIKAYWHWFFTPNRLCWKYWEEFISRGNGKKLPANQEYTPPEPPTATLGQLLLCSPAWNIVKYLLTSSFEVPLTMELDELESKFHEMFPFLHTFQHEINGTKYIILCIRMPRLANALGLPDLCSARYYVKIENNISPVPTAYKISIEEGYGNIEGWNLTDYNNYLADVKVSLLPLIATFKIYVEYYRDQNLEDDYAEMLDYFYNLIGTIDLTDENAQEYLSRLLELNFRCWEKDYFTTSTQLPQKAPDVLIPGTAGLGEHTHNITSTSAITGQSDIEADGQFLLESLGGGRVYQVMSDNEHLVTDKDTPDTLKYRNGLTVNNSSLHVNTTSVAGDAIPSNSGASLGTISQLRNAFALQRWFEKVLRTGTRYIETIKAFFNSDAGDARLQRPEFVGGSSSPIQISDVVQSSATDEYSDTVQGNLAGYGINADNSETHHYHCPEHGFVIGIFSILPRTSYAQGIPKLWSRETWLDYAWSEFEHVGEQGIKQKEIAFAPLTKDTNSNTLDSIAGQWIDSAEEIFGYQSRYSEYKQVPDRFGSGFSSSLDFWSLGRIFEKRPTLSKQFVQAHVSDRNFAVVGNYNETHTFLDTNQLVAYNEAYDYDTYICNFWIDCKKVTSLTLFSEPY